MSLPGDRAGPQMNKFEQVSSGHHQMSLAEGVGYHHQMSPVGVGYLRAVGYLGGGKATKHLDFSTHWTVHSEIQA